MRITDEIASRRAAGHDVVSLCAGEPSARPTPGTLKPAGYTGPLGTAPLREAIAGHYRNWYETDIDPGTVAVTTGSSGAFQLVFLAAFDPGDRVALASPGYPAYRNILAALGVQVVDIPTDLETRFQPTPELLDQAVSEHGDLAGLVLASPANPTGGVLPEDDVRELAALLADRDVIVLSDEIYSRMSYAHPAASIAAMPGMFDKTVILDGFSKTYAMTGWRIGYGHFPAWLVDPVNKLMVNSNSCTASFTQRAALAALEGDQEPAESMIAEFRRRRDAFVEKLNTIPGFRCALPEGAFYAFPNIEGTGWKSKPLADALLQQAGVACLSGTAFGAFGEGYLRLSYANSMENLNEAASRIARFLAAQPPR